MGGSGSGGEWVFGSSPLAPLGDSAGHLLWLTERWREVRVPKVGMWREPRVGGGWWEAGVGGLGPSLPGLPGMSGLVNGGQGGEGWRRPQENS